MEWSPAAALRRAGVPHLSPSFPTPLTSRVRLHVLFLVTQMGGPQGQRKALFLHFLITTQRPDSGSTGTLSHLPFSLRTGLNRSLQRHLLQIRLGLCSPEKLTGQKAQSHRKQGAQGIAVELPSSASTHLRDSAPELGPLGLQR